MREGSTIVRILSDANWFLDRFDPHRCVFTFIKTSRSKLSGARFHDGRSCISLDDTVASVSLEEALDWQHEFDLSRGAQRVIAHISFCGSTLLARILDIDGKVMTYCEPQVFVDLADAMANRHPAFLKSGRRALISRFVFGQFQSKWHSREIPVIKLSNWANNLLACWAQLSESPRLVIVHMDLESYLYANLRGGRHRLRFSLNLLNHLTASGGKHQSVVTQIDKSNADSFVQVLRLLATCYDLQHLLFKHAVQKLDSSRQVRWITKNELVESTTEAVSRVARTFDLKVEQAEIESSIAIRTASHAKSQSGDEFSEAAENSANDTISRQVGNQIAETVDWHQNKFI